MRQAGQSTFFDDRHTDARMRAIISRFARLGSYLTLVTAPLVASGWRLAFLCANVLVAFSVTLAVERFSLLERATHDELRALLVMYGALIANGTGLGGGARSPYLLMQALPALFAAVFFTGRSRYLIAVTVAVEHAGILALYGEWSPGDALTVLGLCLLVAHFGVHISDLLRDSLTAYRALHSVLEVSNDATDTDDLPAIGLAAAISVTGWDAGAVVMYDGEVPRVVAAQGVDPREAVAYAGNHAAFASMSSVPIRYHGEEIGLLVMDHYAPRVPDEREQERLTQVAKQLGLALGNQRAYRREAHLADEQRELNRRKDAFLATVSHELRTPATTITLAAQTLRAKGDRLPAEDRTYALDLLVRRSEELSRMVESLLEEALAESDGLRMELTAIDWCTDLARWVEHAYEQTGRVIVLDLPETPITTLADRAKSERIVSNLLSNAAKFSAAGTPIRCVLDVEDLWLSVSVIDEGMGIPAEARDRIFDRFHQVDSSVRRSAGGFGIGLSLVRRFVEAHGGSVDVQSVEGAGSTFTVRLPRTMVPAARLGTYASRWVEVP